MTPEAALALVVLGFLLTPVLLLVYPHGSAQTLTAISLAAVWANSTSGSIASWRQRRIDVRSGLVFGAATLPGAVGGALVVAGGVNRHDQKWSCR
ncbi:MAG TPA: sulfite exporter TauE/SafE family protein [Gaiellaceae bacterium]|nr:sulfite exporter TauE/SafE family protein [Gaiellaceae bacterium]